MELNGKVMEIKDGMATVYVGVSCGSGSCGNCGGCNNMRTMVVRCASDVEVGDTVNVQPGSRGALLLSFVMYILPIVGIFVGYRAFGYVGGGAGFVLPFVVVRLLDKRFTDRIVGRVTAVIQKRQDQSGHSEL